MSLLSSSRPKVTVGIPMFNARNYVETCLDSVVAQTMPARDVEVICVDDGSTDATVELAKQYRKAAGWAKFRILEQANTGNPSTARNRIIDRASGDYIYFVDVDDYLGPDALARMHALGRECAADVVIGKYVGVNRRVPKVMFQQTKAKTTMLDTPVIDSLSVFKMFRTDYVRSLGYRFNPSIRMAEDHAFALNAYVNTDAIAVEGDTDCYFQVRHTDDEGAAQHLTGKVLPAHVFYSYLYEVFPLIDAARTHRPEVAQYACERYWNRVLTLDVPVEMRRPHDSEGFAASVAACKEVIDRFGARKVADNLSAKGRVMLHAIEFGDHQLIKDVARVI